MTLLFLIAKGLSVTINIITLINSMVQPNHSIELLLYYSYMRKYLTKMISKMISDLKIQKETTYEQIAWSSDLSKSHLSNIVNGHDNISLDTLDRIAKAHNLRVKIEFVLFDKKTNDKS